MRPIRIALGTSLIAMIIFGAIGVVTWNVVSLSTNHSASASSDLPKTRQTQLPVISQKTFFHSWRPGTPMTSTTVPSSVTTTTSSTPPSTTSQPVPATTPPSTSSTASTVASPPTTSTTLLSPGDGVTDEERAEWTKVAVCEEGGWIGYAGSAYPDSLGINAANWSAYGGTSDLSEDAQIIVAMRIQSNPPDQYGCAAW
jgi:hypothetical protein